MKYVALLRGINVGGKTKVEMSRLKLVVESIGCKNVQTYINSGNIIFSDDRDVRELTSLIEAAIIREFGLSVPVLIRDQANIAKLCHEIPSNWTNDATERTDVMFLWDEVDTPAVVEQVIHDPGFERVHYFSGALVWNVERKHVKQGAVVKLINSSLYKQMTIRNINTVRKLNELVAKLPD